jgi:hypothetical protein
MDADDATPELPARHRMRMERRARIGILRNLSAPPGEGAAGGMELRPRPGVEPVEAGADAPDAPPPGAEAGARETAPEVAVEPDAKVPEAPGGDRREWLLSFLAGAVAGLVLVVLVAVAVGWLFAPAR